MEKELFHGMFFKIIIPSLRSLILEDKIKGMNWIEPIETETVEYYYTRNIILFQKFQTFQNYTKLT